MGCLSGLECQKKCPGVSVPRVWDLPTIHRARNPEKSQKVSREEFGTPRPRTPKKFRKKIQNVQKTVKINYFFGLSGLFSELFGGPGSGVPNSSRETFLTLLGVLAFWAL